MSDAPRYAQKPAAPLPAAPFVASTRLLEHVQADLRAALRGEVRFDAGSKALYASDASNYRQIPLGVVVPADACPPFHSGSPPKYAAE